MRFRWPPLSALTLPRSPAKYTLRCPVTSFRAPPSACPESSPGKQPGAEGTRTTCLQRSKPPRKIRHFQRIRTGEMQVVRGSGPSGRIRTAPRPHDHGRVRRSMVRRGCDIWLGQADPDPAAIVHDPARSSQGLSRWPGISAVRPRAPYPTPSRCWKRRRRFASSPFSTRSIWTESIPPKSCRRTFPGTVSTSCWTGSTPRADPSARSSKHTLRPMPRICSSWGPTDILVCGNWSWVARPGACCRSRQLPILLSH